MTRDEGTTYRTPRTIPWEEHGPVPRDGPGEGGPAFYAGPGAMAGISSLTCCARDS
jgi:hypothetical protein